MEANQVTKGHKSPASVWNKIPLWIRNMVIAAVITISIHLSFAFIARGTIISGFDITDSLELPFTFFYFLALFWIYPWISRFVHSSALSNIKRVYVKFIEGFTVVASTVLLSLVLKVLPLWLSILYINSIQDDLNLAFSPDQSRRSFIIYAIIGLFFYYFVERQRIRKQLQEQQLLRAQLQKEKFRVELDNLKDQVNPEFLFNCLNFLDEFIQENPIEAEEFVNRLSNVYRSFLNRQDELITLEEEVMQLDDYFYIIKCRYQNAVIFKLDIEDKATQYVMPPGTLQILIENFITNTNLKKDCNLFIKIYTNSKESMLEIDFQHQLNSNALMNKLLININERYRYFTEKKAEAIDNSKGMKVTLPLLELRENT